jgi:predicted SAM-dependent methyltransferase
MIRFDDLPRALAELRRVLKVGGVLRISVPDMDWLLELWQGPVPLENDTLPIAPTLEPTKDGRILRYMFWHGDARSAFTSTSMAETLNRNGFQNVRFCGFQQTFSAYPEIVDLDGRESESLIVECTR